MASTCPKVLTGRIPLEVRLHDWFHSFFSTHHVYRLYTTLWYEAVMWGYEEWQQFNNNYRYYMKSEVGWSDYITDWGKQMFVFQIWLTRYGYTWKDAWTVRKKRLVTLRIMITPCYPIDDNPNP